MKATTTPWEPSARDRQIYALVAQGGIPVSKIAKRFNLHRSVVYKLVDKVDAWFAPQWMDHIREMKSNHTARLLAIYDHAMKAWRRSLKDAETEQVKGEGVLVGETVEAVPVETVRTKKGQTGNVAYLSQAQSALADIRKIWGADAPLKVEHSGEIRVAGDIEGARQRMREELQKRMSQLEPSSN